MKYLLLVLLFAASQASGQVLYPPKDGVEYAYKYVGSDTTRGIIIMAEGKIKKKGIQVTERYTKRKETCTCTCISHIDHDPGFDGGLYFRYAVVDGENDAKIQWGYTFKPTTP